MKIFSFLDLLNPSNKSKVMLMSEKLSNIMNYKVMKIDCAHEGGAHHQHDDLNDGCQYFFYLKMRHEREAKK